MKAAKVLEVFKVINDLVGIDNINQEDQIGEDVSIEDWVNDTIDRALVVLNSCHKEAVEILLNLKKSGENDG